MTTPRPAPGPPIAVPGHPVPKTSRSKEHAS